MTLAAIIAGCVSAASAAPEVAKAILALIHVVKDEHLAQAQKDWLAMCLDWIVLPLSMGDTFTPTEKRTMAINAIRNVAAYDKRITIDVVDQAVSMVGRVNPI